MFVLRINIFEKKTKLPKPEANITRQMYQLTNVITQYRSFNNKGEKNTLKCLGKTAGFNADIEIMQ